MRWFNRYLLKVQEQFLDHVFYSLQEQTTQHWWVPCFSVRSWQICDAVDMLWKHNSLPQVKCRRKKKLKGWNFILTSFFTWHPSPPFPPFSPSAFYIILHLEPSAQALSIGHFSIFLVAPQSGVRGSRFKTQKQFGEFPNWPKARKYETTW